MVSLPLLFLSIRMTSFSSPSYTTMPRNRVSVNQTSIPFWSAQCACQHHLVWLACFFPSYLLTWLDRWTTWLAWVSPIFSIYKPYRRMKIFRYIRSFHSSVCKSQYTPCWTQKAWLGRHDEGLQCPSFGCLTIGLYYQWQFSSLLTLV